MYLALRRATVLCSIVVALYTIIGSYLFAAWWYGFFWDDRSGRLSLHYVTDGLRWLVDEAFWFAFGILIALICVILLGRLMKRRLFMAIDSAPWVILLCVWLAVAVDALVLRHTQADNYFPVVTEEIQGWYAPPQVVAPIYFHYVDTNRVESLYNQLEPELEVKEREVTGKSTLKADATAGVGETKLGVDVGSEKGTKSTYSRAKFTVDRKCIDVMRYVRDTWPENYFDRPLNWELRSALSNADKQARARIDPSTLTPIQPLGDNKEEQPKGLTEVENRRRSELRSLRGYIFIEGDFEQTVSGDNLILVNKFMDHPYRFWFKTLLPMSAARPLPKTRPLHLTVFGDVTRPLGDDGFVDVVGIAVYSGGPNLPPIIFGTSFPGSSTLTSTPLRGRLSGLRRRKRSWPSALGTAHRRRKNRNVCRPLGTRDSSQRFPMTHSLVLWRASRSG